MMPSWTLGPLRRVPRSTATALVAVAGALLTLPGRGTTPAQDPVHSFSIPATRTAMSLRDRAQEHIEAERWIEALADLQALIEKHQGELLEGTTRDEEGFFSQYPRHLGASEWARQRLAQLPEGPRALYAERYGRHAAELLEKAMGSSDRALLAEVGRRWPWTPEAVRAWLALGDIEFETGYPDEASEAWIRADEVRARAGLPDSNGIQNRLAMVSEDRHEEQGILRSLRNSRPPAEGLRLPGPGEAEGLLPTGDSHAWHYDLASRERSNPLVNVSKAAQLFPVHWGDSVFLSTSFRLHCVDAYSGEARWVSDEPAGWSSVSNRSEFTDGINYRELVLAPSIGSGVAVAALQVPFSQIENQDFNPNLSITVMIPDRRLYAFDARTGEELWNHYPPTNWDGESGSFSERMSVAGPPIVHGSRVIVPAYRLQGRIGFHAACYDLFDGSLLWSSDLISGQRELNMFGRHEAEFCAPSVRVDERKVVVQTQLGTLACLDLYTGELLWETLYDQIPLKGPEDWNASRRNNVWTNQPPVITDGLVIATPSDCLDLCAFDLETGAMRWSIPRRRLTGSTSSSTKMSLLGADRDTVYLGGRTIYACTSPAGLHSTSPPTQVQKNDDLLRLSNYGGTLRPAIAERYAVLPTNEGRVVLDRQMLSREVAEHSAPWRKDRGEGKGNIVLSEGAMFVCNGRQLSGYFEWQLLEDRFKARLAASPEDPATAVAYATFLSNRAIDRLSEGMVQGGLAQIRRARDILAPFTGSLDGGHGGANACMHQLLRLDAVGRAQLSDWKASARSLEAARDLAPTSVALRDTLLHEAWVQERAGDRESWLEVHGLLQQECGSQRVPRTHLPFDPPSTALADPYARTGAEGLPISLWSHLALADGHADAEDIEAELASLHVVLETYGNVRWPDPGGISIHDRIAKRVRERGRRYYEPYEQKAKVLLDASLANQDGLGLERVLALYPLSSAATRASAARLDVALAEGDSHTVALLTLGPLAAEWSPSVATQDEVTNLVLLASHLADLGNRELYETTLRGLAAEYPGLTSPVEADGGASLAELVAGFEDRGEPVAPSNESRFTPENAVGRSLPFEFDYLGDVPAYRRASEDPASAAQRGKRVYVRTLAGARRGKTEVVAYAHGDHGQETWSYTFPNEIDVPRSWRGNTAFTETRVILATHDHVVALDAETGEVAWTWTPRTDSDPDSVQVSDGICLVTTLHRSSNHGGSRVTALDAASGTGLWTAPLPSVFWDQAICSEGKAVLLPRTGNTRIEVLELLTGTKSLEIDLGRHVRQTDVETSWIEDGRLMLPSFHTYNTEPRRMDLSCWDLRTATRTWSLPHRDGRDLYALVHAEDKSYLVFMPSSAGPSSRNNVGTGSLVLLDTRSGAVSTVHGVDIGADDELLGIRRFSATRLDAPFLFLKTQDAAKSEARIHSIHLPFGSRWVHRMAVSPEELYVDPWPLPALSQNAVAFVYPRQREGRAQLAVESHLLMLDRRTGTPLGTRKLEPSMGTPVPIVLRTLGDSLMLRGQHSALMMEVKR